MNTKNVILGMAIAAVILVATVGSASAATKISPSCGDTINTSGIYILTCNLSCPDTHGLIIDADDVTLNGYDVDNCTYHWIDGVNNGNCAVAGPPFVRSGIFTRGDDNVTIKNLEVRHFCVGTFISGPAEECTIEKCKVHSNGNSTFVPLAWLKSTQGIVLFNHTSNGTITKNEIYNNTGKAASPPCESGAAGIHLKSKCSYNDITCNKIYDNNAAGILAKAGCQYNYVANNHIYQNGKVDFTGAAGGCILRCKKSHHWLIEHNNIRNNYGPGMYIGGGWNNLRYNTVKNNYNRTGGDIPVGHGITICRQGDWPNGGRNNTIEENKVCDNEGVDVHVFTAGYFNTGDENCCDATKNYDDEGTTGCTYCCTKDLIITDIWLGRDWRCISREDVELEQKEIAEFIREADVKNVEQEEFIGYLKERDVEQEDLIDYLKERDVDQEAMTKELAAEKCIRGRRVHYRIMNRGCQEWAGWSVSNLTVDGVSPWPPWLGWDLVRPLAPKQSRHEWFWLYRLPGGSHDVKVCADFPNWISECNETNNCLTKTLGGPTLVTPIPIPPRER